MGQESPLEQLRRAAEMRRRTRAFFAARGVMEVETPLLGEGVVVEAHLDPIACEVDVGAGRGRQRRYLLCSPEGPMKRLLCQGVGPIYQFARAFRDGEVGARHRYEFSMLEWYRPGFDHHQLMDEVETLLGELLGELLSKRGKPAFARLSYREVFEVGLGIDPFATDHAQLAALCAEHGLELPAGFASEPLDAALDLLLVTLLEPELGVERPLFVYDYPATQAALARVEDQGGGIEVGRRFELYIDGVELCNGYHELGDAAEQRRRFEEANAVRLARGAEALPMDEDLLAGLAGGLPDCAGVALGFDRLLMLASGRTRLDAG